ncbi:MAG: CPBP family intramembrane metalloprotease [Eggerthellaceae bacterium]|nr:CPBP family intramembrane metalloprotease [Eggerthellaceae bacterium]MBQ9044170.1 CPBP family intramembrane metalloprotease [Eggerthellaceae bacterium]
MPAWHGWLLLGASLFVAVALNVSTFLPADRSIFKVIVVFLIPLVTLLFVAHGNLGTVIKKPRLGDIPLIIIVVVLDMGYSLAIGGLLHYVLGLPTQANAAYGETMDFGFFALVFVQLFGEELFKTNMLLGILLLLFRRSGNRKSAVVIATFVTLLIFGLAHFAAYDSLAQILLIQGLGSVICLFAYLKTKNMLVTYAAHLIIDLIPFGLNALGAVSGGAAAALILL